MKSHTATLNVTKVMEDGVSKFQSILTSVKCKSQKLQFEGTLVVNLIHMVHHYHCFKTSKEFR